MPFIQYEVLSLLIYIPNNKVESEVASRSNQQQNSLSFIEPKLSGSFLLQALHSFLKE